VLRPEPGREEDAEYWLASLSVNRAIMRALEVSEADPCPPARHESQATPRRRDRRPYESPRY
jgi:hypothetical protein